MDIVIDSDEWVVLRMAELRQRGVRAQIHVVVDERNGTILDCYIRRADGREESRGNPDEGRR
jgi:hypothetical protein